MTKFLSLGAVYIRVRPTFQAAFTPVPYLANPNGNALLQ